MSERNTGYQFVSTDTETVEALLISIYEKITGVSVKPASPEKLFIQFVAAVVIQERGLNNYTGNQNIPSRAEGENLDALAELFYVTQRPAAQAAVCTERFHISEAQTTAILIPAGTRVTDASGTLTWETVADAYVSIGATYADVQIRCQTAGAVGNGYAEGQINTFVDLEGHVHHLGAWLILLDGLLDLGIHHRHCHGHGLIHKLLRQAKAAIQRAGTLPRGKDDRNILQDGADGISLVELHRADVRRSHLVAHGSFTSSDTLAD